MRSSSLASEEWREYDWADPESGRRSVYRIEKPQTLYVGHSTHRVVDAAGLTHIVPAVGFHGCVVRFRGEVLF